MIVPPWVYAAGGAALFLAGGISGWTVQGWRCDAAQKDAVEKALKDYKAEQARIDSTAYVYEEEKQDASRQTEQAQTQIHTIYRTQQVEVPGSCEPPADAVRVLDDILAKANARASGKSGG